MATTKRRRRGQRGNTLTTDQEFELMIGPNGGVSAFDSEQALREAWACHAERLIERMSTARPWAWWKYDAAEQPRPGESESNALKRMGVLTATELRMVSARSARTKGTAE